MYLTEYHTTTSIRFIYAWVFRNSSTREPRTSIHKIFQIEGMIIKDEDMNTESTKAIEEQTIKDDTENMEIDEVIL